MFAINDGSSSEMVFYLDAGASASLPGLLFTNANIHLQTGFAEGFVGYRVINCDKAALTLFAGARYSYQGGDLSIFNNGDARLVILRQLLGIPKRLDFSDSTDRVDPVIGARGRVRFGKPYRFTRGDVGGFDANSGSAFEIHRQGRTIATGGHLGSELPKTRRPRISNQPVVLGAGRLALLEIRLRPRGFHLQARIERPLHLQGGVNF